MSWCWFMFFAPVTSAQEKPEPLPAGPHTQYPAPHPATADEEDRFPDVEFVASSKFGSFSYLQPVYRGLNFEGHYFDMEDRDAGVVNGSWTFQLREGIKLSPGGCATKIRKTLPARPCKWGQL